MKKPTLRFMVYASLAVLALGACDDVPIGPDVFGSSSNTSNSSSSSSSGDGGTGGVGGSQMGAGGNGSNSGLSCDPCVNKDGSRIIARRKTTSTDDGLHWEEQVGWYDTQFQMHCNSGIAEDIVMRCIPGYDQNTSLMISSQQSNNPDYYDANCTQRIIASYKPSCGTEPKYALESVGQQLLCKGQPIKVYSLGSYFQLQSVYYRNASNQCVQKAAAPSGYYLLGAAIPASSFALMTETTTP